jgi:sporulation protein YlmC with PRC-barrel domain
MTRARALRLDDVLGKRVVDRDGQAYGRVREIQMDDGDPPTIAFLLAGSAALIIRLGLRGWLRRQVRCRVRAYRVAWATVVEVGTNEVVVSERPERWR